MNISYQNNERVYSNNDIFTDYFNVGVRHSKMRKAADTMLAALSLILTFLTAARTVAVARAIGFGFCLVGFVGIIPKAGILRAQLLFFKLHGFCINIEVAVERLHAVFGIFELVGCYHVR